MTFTWEKEAPKFGAQLNLIRASQKKQEYIEAGELGGELGKDYMKCLNDMIVKHLSLKGHYYIYVLQHCDFLTPEAQKVVMCSGREEHRKLFRPRWGADLWKRDNDRDKTELVWSLPSQETLPLFSKNKEHINPQLLKWIEMFKSGRLT